MSQRPRDLGRKYYVAAKRGLKPRHNRPKHKKKGAFDKYFNHWG